MTQSDSPKSEIIFFLGAGASVEADIPDTKKLILGQGKEPQGFLSWLFFSKKKHFAVLSTILRKFDQKIVDVEFILQLLHDLNSRDENFVTHFFDQDSFLFKSEEDIQTLKELEDLLRQFIHEKVMAKKEKISYLSPLVEFPKPITIFSVNYDTCIELLCLQNKLTYTDGFGLNWQPESFEQNFDIKLFKLHGSIIWYLTNEGNYLKLPILINTKSTTIENTVELISEEIAKPFILYPMGNKSEFAEPLNILITHFQNFLKTAKICIVVGYSFRDKDIRRIFFEIAKQNESLKIILIAPDAGKIFEERLKFYDSEKQILSSLSDKVVCWNYSFGSVLRDYYLYRNLQSTVSTLTAIYAQTEDARRNGAEHWRRNFKDCIQLALNLEDLVTIEKILNKELGIRGDLIEFEDCFSEKEKIQLLYSLAFLYLFNSNNTYKQYFNGLTSYLNRIKMFSQRYLELANEYKKVEDMTIVDLDSVIESDPNDSNLIKTRDALYSDLQGLRQIAFPETKYSFYFWIENKPDFFEAITDLKDFISLKKKLRNGINEHYDTLTALEKTCINILDIWKNTDRYKDSEKIMVYNKIVDLKKNQDLIKHFSEMIDILIKYCETKSEN